MYKIYGNYGFESQTLLEEFARSSEAIRWAESYSRSDMGGYNSIEVISFNDDGEPHTHWHKAADLD